MHKIDDKSREKDNQRNIEAFDRRLGCTPAESSTDGNESDKIFNSNSSWGDSLRENNISGGQATLGKILGTLKLIKEAHLSYVRDHQQRLEARLNQSKEKESYFMDAVVQLEQEILSLLSSSETTD